MAIINLRPGQIIDYIPEQDRGNKNPCVVKIKYLSYGMVQEISERLLNDIIEETRSVRDPDRVMKIKQQVTREAQRRQFVENVVGIENFSVDGKPVTEAGEFYDIADSSLIYEIIRAMESSAKLSEGQIKNLSGASSGA